MRCQVWPLPAPPQTFILWSYGGGAYPVMSRAKAITPVKSSGPRAGRFPNIGDSFAQRPQIDILHHPSTDFCALLGGSFVLALYAGY